MDSDEHQRERMRAFLVGAQVGSLNAESVLDAFDKRFPAPVEPAAIHAQPRVTDTAPVMPMAVDSYTGSLCAVQTIDVNELATLRQKARLWDAVASGKVELELRPGVLLGFYALWDRGAETTGFTDTAEEAVEAAIAAGALK